MSNSVTLIPVQQSNSQQQKVELPKVNIDILKDHPICYSEYRLPPNYIKFTEKTCEDLEEEVEYDMDVEDNVWLNIINEEREQDPEIKDKIPIMQDQFEFLMDRLEKESYFQPASTSPQKNPSASPSLNNSRVHNDSTSDDALCCICLDGECANSNVILFCDMCNLAVHQECYGVPYIPEGQWLCRKCIQSPSAPVNCILCPNKFGAFKQTDHGEWAHVVCAIWIPEVHFANTVFLEPIIGTENIDRARWKLMCYICRKRNVGACIQCDRANCYTAFHVTCAQQAGLYMNIQEEVFETETRGRKKKNTDQNSSSSVVGEVRKCAYCDVHTPLELSPKSRKSLSKSGSMNPNSLEYKEAVKQAQKARMKKARKILAEQRKAPPVVCLPVISNEKIENILSNVEFDSKEKFMAKLVNYWLLKRYARNGVPILRRLQNSGSLRKHKNEMTESKYKKEEELDDEKKLEMKEKFAQLKKIRQDLEKARLLMELVRKREKHKRDLIRIDELQTLYEINPFNGVFLQRILDIIVEFDTKLIFTQPVDPIEVPTYYDFIKEPIDLSKMQSKIDNLEYENFDQFEADFNLMINNCLRFNAKNNYYYKAAIKLKDQVSIYFKNVKKICESIGTADDFVQMIKDSGITEKTLKEIENLRQEFIGKNGVTENKTDKKPKLNTPSTAKKTVQKLNTPVTATTTRTRQSLLFQTSSAKLPSREQTVLSNVENENLEKIDKKPDKKSLKKSPPKPIPQNTTPVKSTCSSSRKSVRLNREIDRIEETVKEDEENNECQTRTEIKTQVKNERRNSLRSSDHKELLGLREEYNEEDSDDSPKKRLRVSTSELKGLEMWSAPSVTPSKRLKNPRHIDLNKSEMNDDEMDNNSMRVETDDLDQTEDERFTSAKSRVRTRSARKSLTQNDFEDERISETKNEYEEKQSEQTETPSKSGVNRRTAVLFKRNKSGTLMRKNSTSNVTTRSENLKKADSVSDVSATDSNNKDLMNISGSTNQTNDSNN